MKAKGLNIADLYEALYLGHRLVGYDPATNKYKSVWVASFEKGKPYYKGVDFWGNRWEGSSFSFGLDRIEWEIID